LNKLSPMVMVENTRQQNFTWHGRESPYLTFGKQALRIEGDPETPTDFSRALNYLETITAHWLECGALEAKTAWDVAYELSYHNAWHQFEIAEERKAGEKQAEYRAINLHQLHALSKRRVLALKEAGWAVTPVYQVVQQVDTLIEQAVLEQEQLEQLMATTGRVPTARSESPTTVAEDVPF
jgi:hypothetical protein